MTNDLKCVGGERRVVIDYKIYNYQRATFFINGDYRDSSGGGTIVAYDFTEGGITYNLTERLERRRQTSVGTYQTCQGNTGYWITRYTSPNQLEGNPSPVEGRFPGQVVWGFPIANEPGSGVRVYPVPQGVHDSWLANGTGWYSPAGYPWLAYLENCNNPNASGAISASVSASFRYPITYWNIQIFTGGIKLHDRSDFDLSSIYSYENWLRGGGVNYLASPEQINPETGLASLRVVITPRYITNKQIIHHKRDEKNGLRLIESRINKDNRTVQFKLEEVDPETNQLINFRWIEQALFKGKIDSYSLSCDKKCPDNSCSVDCGDKICCYGSDGIAIHFYYK